MLLRSVAILCLWTSTCQAQILLVKITAPQEAKVGEIIECRAESEEGRTVAWGLVQSVPYKLFESGTVLVFSAPTPGRYEAVCFVAVATVDGKILIETQRHVVQVTGRMPTPPDPGPNPNPVPPPDPFVPVPDDEWGFVAIAKTAPADNKDKIGANFRNVAAQIAAGTITSESVAIATVGAMNKAVLGTKVEVGHPWYPFATAVSKRLTELKNQGKIQGLVDLGACFRELGDAMK